jgi:SufS family cysteine desulfurase
MPIPKLDAEAPGEGSAVAGDPFDTALISKLANEIFANSPGAPQPSGPFPSAPAAVAGVPGALTVPTTDGHGLTGGYPSAAPESQPPVHSAVEPASPEVSQPEQAAISHPSGAHDPESSSSYAFGEPHFNGTVFESRDAAPSQSPGIGADETPDFYFLSGKDAGVKSALPGITRNASTPALSVFDIEAIRRDFPALHQRVNGHPLIWLDNAATTHKPQSVIDATSHFYSRDNSNIHRAAHTVSERATQAFEAGREKVRQFLGAADKKEIVFLRGTTEAINLVAQSYGKKNIGQGDEIILTELEHHANIVPWQLLAEQIGALIRVIPINDRGELVLEEYAKLLGPRTKIVSVAHVSNSLGTINPIEEIIPLAHARGVPVLIDGAQSTPHIPIKVSALDADFFVFSAHKIFGPTGIGALYGKSHLLESMPPYQGGGHMIRDVRFEKTVYQNAPEKFEAGTPDIAGVVGLGAAIDYLTTVGIPAIAAYEHALLEYATQALATVRGLRPIGTAQNKASVLSFVIAGVPNENIARHLDKHGIAVRAGHHCALPAQRHFGLETTVRPSLAFYNTYAEVDTLVRVLHELPRS